MKVTAVAIGFSLAFTGSLRAQGARQGGGNITFSPNMQSSAIGSSNANGSVVDPRSSIYIHGRIAMDDGSEVPANVVIEKVCQSQATALGYADRKGHFSVTLASGNSAGFSDASYDSSPQDSGANSVMVPMNGGGGAQFRQTLVGCEIRASYEGIHSDSIHLTNPRALDTPDIGTLTMHHASSAGATTVSATTLNAPKNALKAYEQGMDALRKAKPDVAERDFRKAVELHPVFATAWYELGRLDLQKDPRTARQEIEKAIQADPKYILPYLELSKMTAAQKSWQETVEITNRALRLDGESFPQLYFYNAVAQFNLKNYEQAEKKARETIRLDVEHQFPKATRLLGYVLAIRGDIHGAAEQMRAYLAGGLSALEAQSVRSDIAALESRLTAAAVALPVVTH